MRFRRSLLGLLIAALAMFYTLGSSSAAMACASPAAAMPSPTCSGMPCGGERKAHDCAMACTPMCAAVVPDMGEAGPPPVSEMALLAGEMRQLIPATVRPEPPPPRMGSI